MHLERVTVMENDERTMDEITQGLIREASEQFHSGIREITSDSVIKGGIENASVNRDSVIKMSHLFSDEIDTMEITDQKESGRCWIFAGMNFLRYRLHQNLKLKNPDFELSQAYLMFWDKVERSNYFLECVLDTLGERKDSRLVMWLFQNPLGDGGQWDMLVSLIEKYGVVPKYAMPESFHSGKSSKMNAILSKKLRQDGILLRKLYAQGENIRDLKARKSEMVREFYGLVCCFLGEPPRSFDFDYRDKDNVFHREAELTPKEFFEKHIGSGYLNEYVSIINAPTDDKPYGCTYTVKYLGNVVGGRKVTYLNLAATELERLACLQILDGETVWFGSDVGQYSQKDYGIMDTALFDYEKVLDTSLKITKADMLDYGESCLTHAMQLVGVDRKNGKIIKWKVENSWGKDVGEKGFYVMSPDWFNDYVCQVVVNRKYLTQEQRKALAQKQTELQPWDPIGALALTD